MGHRMCPLCEQCHVCESKDCPSTGGTTFWTPEPILGFRLGFDSMGGEPFYYGKPAKCRRGGDHIAPSWFCRCGYYGMKALSDVGPYNFAVVLFYGDVIEHADGYRAQFMWPVAYGGDNHGMGIRLPRGFPPGMDFEPKVVTREFMQHAPSAVLVDFGKQALAKYLDRKEEFVAPTATIETFTEQILKLNAELDAIKAALELSISDLQKIEKEGEA